MNNIVMIILDSCRFDTFKAANTKHFSKIGKIEKRYSYASWTAPSHYAFLMGIVPHESRSGKLAAQVYREEFTLWNKRIGTENLSFEDLIPEISLVKKLKELGYKTTGRVSMPVLNQNTVFSRYFDDYKLMDHHNSFAEMVQQINFNNNQPSFYFLNLGETHYPYMLSGDEIPHISGLHGVLKKWEQNDSGNGKNVNTAFSALQFDELKKQQVKAVKYCDTVFEKLLIKSPDNTYFIITSDHGELFGENGYFGHGPIMHPKVFEVFYIEGKIK